MTTYVVSTILLILSILFKTTIIGHFLIVISFIILFTAFDVVGWGLAIHRQNRVNDLTIRIPYRIMQNTFMYLFWLYIWSVFGFWTMIAALIPWWFGACDVLFYLILNEPLFNVHYDWMEGWSVHWAIKKLAPTYECRLKYFILLSVIGLIIAFAILLV